MLKFRLLTAFLLIPLFIYLLYALSPAWFCILTTLILLWAAWEWSALMEIRLKLTRSLYVFFMAWMMLVAFFIPILPILYLSLFFWISVLFFVLFYPKGNLIWGRGVMVRGLMGVMVLIPCWCAINWLRNAEDGKETVLFLFILIWGADSIAYFIGKKWGKHLLIPAVSPGKTWEGFIAALVMSIIIALSAALLSHIPSSKWIFIILLSFLTVLFSILGDLFESMLKRQAKLKDSGKLLPGHGGLLDRVDSLMPAAPIFSLMAYGLSQLSS